MKVKECFLSLLSPFFGGVASGGRRGDSLTAVLSVLESVNVRNEMMKRTRCAPAVEPVGLKSLKNNQLMMLGLTHSARQVLG